MRFATALIAAVFCCIKSDGAVRVDRVQMLPRNVRGSTNLQVLGPWDTAAWIWADDRPLKPEGEFLRFRRDFVSDGDSPLRFHVSADQRFILLVDGETVARGPDRGAPDMWFVQSYETRLAKGPHRIEAVCWRLPPDKAPNAQLSLRGGFLFKAEGAYDAELTTGRAAWGVARVSGTKMGEGKYPMALVGAQCRVYGSGIEGDIPDDTAYRPAVVVRGAVRPNPSGSSRTPGWMLYPSELPAQLSREVRPGRIVAADDKAFDTNGVWSAVAKSWCSNGWYRVSAALHPSVPGANGLVAGKSVLTVPANTKLRLLWDLEEYFCAYPELVVSGGKGSRLGWGWAESLYVGDAFDWHTVVTDRERKGPTSRAEWRDKYFYGPVDEFFPDGRERARFTIPWWRCGRWCQLEVETGDEPIDILDAKLVETRYPLESEAYFECDNPTVSPVCAICLRGLKMCMHEMHFDCPHYEQQMYGGDTRIQMLVVDALTSDDRLTRQAFRLFESSQRDNGMVSMNYPTRWLQESPTFSLYWTMMLGDYAMWHDDVEWIRSRMHAVRKCLGGFEPHVGDDGLLRDLPGWCFIDWVPDWPVGAAPGGSFGEGVSSVNNLLYLIALRSAVRLESCLGEEEMCARWTRLADALADSVVKTFWSDERGMVADTPAKDSFSEHAQSLAILSGVLDGEKEDAAFTGLVSAPDLARCTVSFSHYLFATLVKKGRTDLLLKKLDLWRDMVRRDLKTTVEGPGDTRSDCHAWGAHPLFHLLTGVAGIRPAEPGFGVVLVAPQPGGLKRIRAGVPTPKGAVEEDLSFEDGRVRGTVKVPEGMHGVFEWGGESVPLAPGVVEIDMPKNVIEGGCLQGVVDERK